MQRIRSNTFQCDVGETVTMTFVPSNPGIVSVGSREKTGDEFISVGDDLTLSRTIGSEQVTITIEYVFFPGDTGNCRIFLKGSNGGEFENRPPAKDRAGLPETRTYRFRPLE